MVWCARWNREIDEAMRHFDNDFAEEVLERLDALPADAAPRWGQLRRDTLIQHLIWAVRHSMGRSTQVPFIGNWFTQRVARPLILCGAVRFPKNIRLPRHAVNAGATMLEPGDIETLHALFDEYIALVQADELEPAPHPAFGRLDIDGWDRVHVLHFEHHLRQFGV